MSPIIGCGIGLAKTLMRYVCLRKLWTYSENPRWFAFYKFSALNFNYFWLIDLNAEMIPLIGVTRIILVWSEWHAKPRQPTGAGRILCDQYRLIQQQKTNNLLPEPRLVVMPSIESSGIKVGDSIRTIGSWNPHRCTKLRSPHREGPHCWGSFTETAELTVLSISQCESRQSRLAAKGCIKSYNKRLTSDLPNVQDIESNKKRGLDLHEEASFRPRTEY